MESVSDLTRSLARRLGCDPERLLAWPGRPFPLGAGWDGEGTNFSIWSPSATKVQVCLFDGQGAEHRVELAEQSFHIWHGYLPGINPGQRYGYRITGPDRPGPGQLYN